MFLAAAGLYSVIAYVVPTRTHDLGLRLALGATPRDLIGMVFRESLSVVVIGATVGVPDALGLSHLIASKGLGATATDPLTLAGALVLVAAISPLASFPQRVA
jgi:putative ABC transport system permease protein